MAEKALDDDSPEVRVAAANALGEMQSRASIPKLREALWRQRLESGHREALATPGGPAAPDTGANEDRQANHGGIGQLLGEPDRR